MILMISDDCGDGGQLGGNLGLEYRTFSTVPDQGVRAALSPVA